jgi:competence protein ComEA
MKKRRYSPITAHVGHIVLFGCAMVIAVFLASCSQSPQIILEESESLAGPSEVWVHVAGAIQLPGLYKLPGGSRVADAVNLAGGPTYSGDTDALNLAALLKDGENVVVPLKSLGAPQLFASGMPSGAPSALPSAGIGKTNLNSANQAELEDLPGIGEVLAQRSIDYRTQRGPFRAIEDVKEVSGIGDKRFEAIRELITVE